MAQLGDLIMRMAGHADPRQQLLQAVAGGHTPRAGDHTSSAAAGGPGTSAPQQPPQQPQAYTSPPELMELYMNLMKRQEQNQALNRGLGMFAAGLAQDQNRQAILAATQGGGSSGGGGDAHSLFQMVMGMQQQQMELQQRAAQRAAVPSIASKYGLDVQTALYLFDAGKLDQVISELEKPNKQVVQQPDGQHIIVDKNTGQLSEPFGVPKQREVELVEDPSTGSKIAVWADTKEPVGDPSRNLPGKGVTADEQNYNTYVQQATQRGEQPMTFDQWVTHTRRATAGTGNLGPSGIDFGEPEKGFVWQRAEDGSVATTEDGRPIQVPIAGGSVEAERAAAEQMADKRQFQSSIASSIISTEGERARNLIEEGVGSWFPRTGLVGSVGQFVPQTPQYELAQALGTIRSRIGFEQLQQMREASPTGGALGQVSDFENRLLQSVLGSLDIGLSPDALLWRLDRVENIFKLLDSVLYAPDMATAESRAAALDKAMQSYERFVQSREDGSGEVSVDELLERYR